MRSKHTCHQCISPGWSIQGTIPPQDCVACQDPAAQRDIIACGYLVYSLCAYQRKCWWHLYWIALLKLASVPQISLYMNNRTNTSNLRQSGHVIFQPKTPKNLQISERKIINKPSKSNDIHRYWKWFQEWLWKPQSFELWSLDFEIQTYSHKNLSC